MDELGHAGLEDENMEATLEEVLNSEREREDIIELVLRLVKEVVMEHPQRLGRCDQIWRGDELRWRRQRRRRGELSLLSESLFCSSLRSPQPAALSPRPTCRGRRCSDDTERISSTMTRSWCFFVIKNSDFFLCIFYYLNL